MGINVIHNLAECNTLPPRSVNFLPDLAQRLAEQAAERPAAEHEIHLAAGRTGQGEHPDDASLRGAMLVAGLQAQELPSLAVRAHSHEG